MKKLLLMLLTVGLLSMPGFARGHSHGHGSRRGPGPIIFHPYPPRTHIVGGYIKTNGRYVDPHVQSNPYSSPSYYYYNSQERYNITNRKWEVKDQTGTWRPSNP